MIRRQVTASSGTEGLTWLLCGSDGLGYYMVLVDLVVLEESSFIKIMA